MVPLRDFQADLKQSQIRIMAERGLKNGHARTHTRTHTHREKGGGRLYIWPNLQQRVGLKKEITGDVIVNKTTKTSRLCTKTTLDTTKNKHQKDVSPTFLKLRVFRLLRLTKIRPTFCGGGGRGCDRVMFNLLGV